MRFLPVPGTAVLYSIWETRVKDYEIFARSTERKIECPTFPQTPEDPVVNVSWEDAKDFCTWLTGKETRAGKISRQQIYRLPTDAEWSIAVGLPHETEKTPRDNSGKIAAFYPWGTQWPPPKGAGNYSPKLGVDSFGYTSPVGSFSANQYGLYDMGGNAWEWCEDWIDKLQKYRVMRGASWSDTNRDVLLSSCRGAGCPRGRVHLCSFRCVLSERGRGILSSLARFLLGTDLGVQNSNTTSAKIVVKEGNC